MFVPVPAGRRSPPNPAVMKVVFTVMLVAGLIGTYVLGLRPWLQSKEAERWNETGCRIVWSGVKAEAGSKGRTNYSVGVDYAYEWKGRKYHGARYDFRPTSSGTFEESKAVVDRLPPGTETTCWVNPDVPAESVIDRSVGSWILVGLAPLFFVGIAIVGLMAARSAAPRRGAPAAPPPGSIPPRPDAIHPS